MTIQQIYDLAVEMGSEADPRGIESVRIILKKRKKAFEELSEKKKKYFDKETLTNPYSDTRVFTGDPKVDVKYALAGIDTDATEVLLADRLNEKGGRHIDAVIGHHPAGHAYASLHDVMDLQVDVYAQEGAPVNVIDSLMKERQEIVKRKIHPVNHNQVIDSAKLLNMPLMVLHTVWDNMGDHFMKDYIKKRSYDTVEDILDYLMELPEYQEATKGKNAPEIVSGTGKSRAGRVALFFTGGTNPSKEIYAEMAKAGIGTLVDMHIPEDGLQEAKKHRMNVINAGHMASDSIGANLFFDELETRGVEIIPCSGLIRVRRKA